MGRKRVRCQLCGEKKPLRKCQVTETLSQELCDACAKWVAQALIAVRAVTGGEL